MLSATEAVKLRSNIQRVIRGIGHTNGTKLPESRNNQAPIFLQYWLMSFLSKMLHGMMDEAKRNAVREGVLMDHKANPLPEGTEKQVFSCDVGTISVKVKKASMRLDVDTLKHNLRVAKVKEEVIEKALRDSMVYNAAAHEFSAVLAEKPE